jgi:hypothetical protein
MWNYIYKSDIHPFFHCCKQISINSAPSMPPAKINIRSSCRDQSPELYQIGSDLCYILMGCVQTYGL